MKKSINYLSLIILLSFISVNIICASGIIKTFSTSRTNIDRVEFLKELKETTCSNYIYKTKNLSYLSEFKVFYNLNNYGYTTIFSSSNKGINRHLEKVDSFFIQGSNNQKTVKECDQINNLNIEERKNLTPMDP